MPCLLAGQHGALCTRCGQDRPALGTLDGQPYCPYCWEKVRPAAELCADCGRLPAALTSRQDGLRRCRRCHHAKPGPCTRCGTVTKAERHWPEGPVCLTCVDTVRFTHATCTSCRQHRPVFVRDSDGHPPCPECSGIQLAYTCTMCGGMGRIHSHRRCPPCRAAQRLDEVFTAGPDHLKAELAPLYQHLAGYPSPYTVIAYLDGAGGRLIQRLLTGGLACTHEGLDQLRQTASVTRLRSLLTAVGLVPSRDEHLARARHQAQILLDNVHESADRLLLARYLRWTLLPAAHEHTERTGRLGPHHARYLLEQLRTAHAFTHYLRTTGSTLADCTQPHIDA